MVKVKRFSNRHRYRYKLHLKLCYNISKIKKDTPQDEVKSTLIDFLEMYKGLKPDKFYTVSVHSMAHISYLNRLMNINAAFRKSDYPEVCHQVHAILVTEPFLQPRIHTNLIKVLERYLN